MVIANGGMTINEILRGMEVRRMQSVGMMQVIPLTMEKDLWDDRFASPKEGAVDTDSGYGNMNFRNPTDKTMLIPSHVGYVISKQGQDHAMSHAGMVKKRGSKLYNTACCIQASQDGAINSDVGGEMLILPYSLRERALAVRGIRDEYSKIWPDIQRFNSDMGVPDDGGHLTYFLQKFKTQLDEFVAEFECVPGQCGAIILVDGQVVGIERAPSPKFWRDIWTALIRECYGSLSIEVAQKRDGHVPSTRVPLRVRGVSSLDDIANALKKAREKEEDQTNKIVRKLLNDPFAETQEEKLSEFNLLTLKNDQFTGQVVRDGEKVCYASLFTTKDWAKNAPWRSASKFSI